MRFTHHFDTFFFLFDFQTVFYFTNIAPNYHTHKKKKTRLKTFFFQEAFLCELAQCFFVRYCALYTAAAASTSLRLNFGLHCKNILKTSYYGITVERGVRTKKYRRIFLTHFHPHIPENQTGRINSLCSSRCDIPHLFCLYSLYGGRWAVDL